MPFFPIFHEKITTLMSIFCQKNLLKNTLFSCPYFVKKTSILSKTQCSHVILFKFFMKNPILSCPYLLKKRQFCHKYTIVWDKKSIGFPFFRFSRKNHCSHAHILSKNVHSLKNPMLSCPYFVEKTSISIINCDFDPKSCHKCSTPPPPPPRTTPKVHYFLNTRV